MFAVNCSENSGWGEVCKRSFAHQVFKIPCRDDAVIRDDFRSVMMSCELMSNLAGDVGMEQGDSIVVADAAVNIVLVAHDALSGRSSQAISSTTTSSSSSSNTITSPLLYIQTIAEFSWSILSSLVRAEGRYERGHASESQSKLCAEHLVGSRDLLQLLQDIIQMSPASAAAAGVTQRILSEGAVLALNLFISGVAGAARIDIANALRMEEGKAAAASSSVLLHTLIMQMGQGDARAMAGASRCLTSIIAAFSGEQQQQQQQQPDIIRSILTHPSFNTGFVSCLKLALSNPSIRSIVLAFAHTVLSVPDAQVLLTNWLKLFCFSTWPPPPLHAQGTCCSAASTQWLAVFSTGCSCRCFPKSGPLQSQTVGSRSRYCRGWLQRPRRT